MSKKLKKPKVLVLDIETSPIISYTWGLWDQNVGLNQIIEDWHVLSWAAKWLDEKKVMYEDQRHSENIRDDKKLLKGIWKLLNECDVVITQNGIKFDIKKLNARFVINGFQPPSGFQHIDTLKIAKKHFGFTSNKLEYMTSKLCDKNKKSSHKKFPGFELWKGCIAGNKKAWKEMEKYNKLDVTSLEELYYKLIPWDNRLNFNLFHNSEEIECSCGSTEFQRNGFHFTAVSKFQRYRCKSCGAENRGRKNLFKKDKRASLRVRTKK